MATPTFPPFRAYVCENDSVTLEHGGFTITARIERDDCSDTPEQRDEGFWPSLDTKAAGYIGAKSARTFTRQTVKAAAILEAWRRDEWFYCGVVVTVERNGVPLTGKYSAAIWGVECNYPGTKNEHLNECANEQLDEALDLAWERIDAVLQALQVTA